MLVVANVGTQTETKRTKANMPQHSSIQCGSPTLFQRRESQNDIKTTVFKPGIQASQNRN